MSGRRSAILLALATAIAAQAALPTVSEQCTQGLALLQGRDEVELAARCRAAFSPNLCREAARSLGAQPWAPERMQASCDRLAGDFVAASPELSARGLEAAVAGKSDLDKSAGGKEASAAAPTPQASAGGFLSTEAKAVADKSVPVTEREPTAEEATVDADAAAVVVEEQVDAAAPAGAAAVTANGAGDGSGAGAAPAEVAAVVNKAAATVATAAKPAVAEAGKTAKAGAKATSADVTAVVDKAAAAAATAAEPAKAAAEKTVKAGAKAVEEVKPVVAAQGEKKVLPTTRALEDEESISKKTSDEKAKEQAKKEKAKGGDKSEIDDGEDKDVGEEEDESGEEESEEDAEEDSEKDEATSSLDNTVRLFGGRLGGSGHMASEKAGVLPHTAFLLAGIAAFSAALFGARRSRMSRGTLPRLPEDSSEGQLVE